MIDYELLEKQLYNKAKNTIGWKESDNKEEFLKGVNVLLSKVIPIIKGKNEIIERKNENFNKYRIMSIIVNLKANKILII